jgi:glucan biosynthesis protein C
MDFARAVLFSLGIVLHAAWLFQNRLPAMAGTHDFIHSFRMQSFFIVAGFFSAIMFEKYPIKEFLTRRLRRLGVPLVVFGFIIDPLLNCSSIERWADFSSELNFTYWANAQWFHHLWFLAVLLQYVLLMCFVADAFPGVWSAFKARHLGLNSFYILVAFGYALCTRVPTDPDSGLIFIRPYETLKFITFFIAGLYLYYHQPLLDRLVNNVVWNLLYLGGFWVALPWLSTLNRNPFIQMLHAIYALNMCLLLFWLARRFFNRRNDLIQKFANASYTVYLVHWPLMIVFYRMLESSNLSRMSQMVLLIMFTAIFSYSIHALLVLRFKAFAFLFNGVSPEEFIFKPHLSNA